jgi:hypothetical protein
MITCYNIATDNDGYLLKREIDKAIRIKKQYEQEKQFKKH